VACLFFAAIYSNNGAMATKELSLKTDIARLLRVEFGAAGVVTCPGKQITLTISTSSLQRNYGSVLQQIHRVINECYPDRTEHMFILICDEAGSFKNIIKVWKSV
jgi:hypothetical protein